MFSSRSQLQSNPTDFRVTPGTAAVAVVIEGFSSWSERVSRRQSARARMSRAWPRLLLAVQEGKAFLLLEDWPIIQVLSTCDLVHTKTNLLQPHYFSSLSNITEK